MRQNSFFFLVLADYISNYSNRLHANVEVRYCEVGRSGSLINFYPEGKSPLRGYIRNADTSRRDWSTCGCLQSLI